MNMVFGLMAGGALLVMGGVMYFIRSFNLMHKLRKRCQRAWADIDVYLRQRHDMIPQLVETLHGLMRHENRIVQEVLHAQTRALQATAIDERIEAENALSNVLANILPELNKIPELYASREFISLREAIIEIEEKLAAARRHYNLAVDEYNTALEQFPGMLFKGKMDFQPFRFFSLGMDRPMVEQRPAVQF